MVFTSTDEGSNTSILFIGILTSVTPLLLKYWSISISHIRVCSKHYFSRLWLCHVLLHLYSPLLYLYPSCCRPVLMCHGWLLWCTCTPDNPPTDCSGRWKNLQLSAHLHAHTFQRNKQTKMQPQSLSQTQIVAKQEFFGWIYLIAIQKNDCFFYVQRSPWSFFWPKIFKLLTADAGTVSWYNFPDHETPVTMGPTDYPLYNRIEPLFVE